MLKCLRCWTMVLILTPQNIVTLHKNQFVLIFVKNWISSTSLWWLHLVWLLKRKQSVSVLVKWLQNLLLSMQIRLIFLLLVVRLNWIMLTFTTLLSVMNIQSSRLSLRRILFLTWRLLSRTNTSFSTITSSLISLLSWRTWRIMTWSCQ